MSVQARENALHRSDKKHGRFKVARGGSEARSEADNPRADSRSRSRGSPI